MHNNFDTFHNLMKAWDKNYALIHEVSSKLNEDADADIKVDNFPKIKHTDNAFQPGEIVYLYLQKMKNRDAMGGEEIKKITWVIVPAKILNITGDSLEIQLDKKRAMLKKNSPKIKCTDTWKYIYNMLGCTGQKQEGHLSTTDISIDYQVIEGELCIVVTNRNSLKDEIKFYYKYDDVRNAMKTGERCRSYRIKGNENLDSTEFWLTEGDIKPKKSKNPIPNSVNVPKEWIVTRSGGQLINTDIFIAWNIDKAEEICSECPWLETKPAVWEGKNEEGKQERKKTIPAEF